MWPLQSECWQGKSLLYFSFRSRPGPCSAPAESQDLGNQDPVGSPAEASQTTLAAIIANEIPFKAGGLRDGIHVWKTITSDPFILDAVTHCHIEFDWKPRICTSITRPFYSFTEIELTIIDNEVKKFLLKGIIRLSSHDDGQVISPILRDWSKSIGGGGVGRSIWKCG